MPVLEKQTVEEILTTAQDMIQSGADVLDIGGMSTRPGSDPLLAKKKNKRERIITAVKAIREKLQRHNDISRYI